MENNKFKILSLDGGGIKGVFTAKFLTSIEDEIGEGNTYKHFDLIAGTSTGSIIALSLSLGIPAKEILDLYLNHAREIFSTPFYNKIPVLSYFFLSYDNKKLETLIRKKFQEYFNSEDPLLGDAKTNLIIPTYSLLDGNTQILKTPHAQDLFRDKHIPMYMAAMASSAAPTFFKPYSSQYKKGNNGVIEYFSNKVDGGVYANNPSMIALLEAQSRFNKELKDIQLLSIGTGNKKFAETEKHNSWSSIYWLKNKKIVELFMQSQSQIVHNSISVLDRAHKDFVYKRVSIDFDHKFYVKMDETNTDKLKTLVEKSGTKFQYEGKNILETFFNV